MQEQINEKTVALSIKTAKLTAEVLQKAIKKMLEAQKHKAAKEYRGKQTLKHLMKQNTGVSNMEITDANIKAFEPVAKKYGIDYSLKKVKGEKPPRYLVFFKGRDVDVMTEAFKEFAAKKLNREKKPSIRKALAAFKEKAKQVNQNREKVKNKDRGREL
jgi:viroplasmin and RNaseH domain-containing protein|nr:PcfB family protein [uncultured Marvinbryantia sp.]